MIRVKEAAVLAATAVLLIGGWTALTGIDGAEHEAQTRMVAEAVKNAALTCYAVEGAYPMSLGYLKENYGLAFDEGRYRVSYDAFSSNLFPEIRVTEIG